MNLQELYEMIGGNYQDVFERMYTDVRIIKYIKKFVDDSTYDELSSFMSSGDAENAFRMAHSLKGMALNLAFTSILKSSSELCELLRNQATISQEAINAKKVLDDDNKNLISAINAFLLTQ